MAFKWSAFLVGICLAAQLSAQKNPTYSEPSVSPVVIDGNSREWRDPFRYYDGASKLQFSFRNDSANLYICIKTGDEQAQRKMTHGGLNFSIETAKKTTAVLNFPTPWQHLKSQVPEGSAQGGRAEAKAMRRQMAIEIKAMKLKGFNGIPDGVYESEKEGVIVSLNWDSLDLLTAEYKIPFNRLFAVTDTTKFFTALIVVKGLDIPVNSRMQPAAGQNPNRDIEDGSLGTMNDNMRGHASSADMANSRSAAPPPGYMDGAGNTLGQDNTIKLSLKLASW